MEEIINIVYEKIKSLEAGTEVTIFQLIPKEARDKYTIQQLFEVTSKVFMKCKDNNISLNHDKYKDKEVGLPYYIPFIKE